MCEIRQVDFVLNSYGFCTQTTIKQINFWPTHGEAIKQFEKRNICLNTKLIKMKHYFPPNFFSRVQSKHYQQISFALLFHSNTGTLK